MCPQKRKLNYILAMKQLSADNMLASLLQFISDIYTYLWPWIVTTTVDFGARLKHLFNLSFISVEYEFHFPSVPFHSHWFDEPGGFIQFVSMSDGCSPFSFLKYFPFLTGNIDFTLESPKLVFPKSVSTLLDKLDPFSLSK